MTLPEVAANPEQHDDGDGQHSCKKALDISVAATYGADGGVELSGKDENAKGETDPRSVNTKDGLVRNLIDSVTVILPSSAESNV